MSKRKPRQKGMANRGQMKRWSANPRVINKEYAHEAQLRASQIGTPEPPDRLPFAKQKLAVVREEWQSLLRQGFDSFNAIELSNNRHETVSLLFSGAIYRICRHDKKTGITQMSCDYYGKELAMKKYNYDQVRYVRTVHQPGSLAAEAKAAVKTFNLDKLKRHLKTTTD